MCPFFHVSFVAVELFAWAAGQCRYPIWIGHSFNAIPTAAVDPWPGCVRREVCACQLDRAKASRAGALTILIRP
jgi:hypothetical protein